MTISRRTFLHGAVVAGGAICLDPARLARAMGAADVAQGFREITGTVTRNGRPARVGDPVRPGDVVETGPDGRAAFVAGTDAYLLRSGTRLEIPADAGTGADGVLARVRVAGGRVMGVFGGGGRMIETPTAVAGIRGTGLYVEAEPARSYLCTCYGTVRVLAVNAPGVERTVETRHHEHPLYVSASADGGGIIVDAPMKNHTDDELRMLEALVGRKPPFGDAEMSNEYGNRYDGG